MLYLKIMSGQDMPDSDPYKDFTLYTLGDKDVLEFERRVLDEDVSELANVYAVVELYDGGRIEHLLQGSAYVLNAQGKTIASRGLKNTEKFWEVAEAVLLGER